MTSSALSPLKLRGVDHTAGPTWKLRETVEFYRDKLGLPLIHVISARGWGPSTHPDFLHFFFDSGKGSTIAFFYYLGSDQPDSLDGRSERLPVPEDHVFDATHTAWLVDSEEELQAWNGRLEEHGLNVSVETRHEVIESIIPRFHAEYLGHSTAWMRRCRITSESRIIYPLPIVHNAGQLYALLPPAAHGVTIMLMPRPEVVRMLDLVGQHRVTDALSIGPIAPQLLAYTDIDKHDLSSLQLFSTMSRADALESHPNVPCSNLYGITEGSLLASPADAPVFARHHTQGASGCADDEIKLFEPETEQEVPDGKTGELCFRGPSTVCGFFDNPAANATTFTSDGFYRTGDMVTRHVIGGMIYITFEGRLRDHVNRGGEKIGCEEVEGFVCQHPAVADAKLVAMPDALYGEKGCILIVARPGMEPPDVKTLANFLVDKGLAKFKCPECVEIIEEFPVTRVGKLDKPALKNLIAETLALETSGVKP